MSEETPRIKQPLKIFERKNIVEPNVQKYLGREGRWGNITITLTKDLTDWHINYKL